MSLPAASKVVTENPPNISVTVPTNREEKEKDIERKLRLYGVIQAFSNGRMPDNAQIEEILVYVRDHSPIDTNQLSAEGRKLIQDVRNIIETARLFVKQKNADEVVQQLFYHTSGAQFDTKKTPADAPVTEKQARRDAQEALGHLRNLFQLLLTNSEARKLLADFKLIGRGLFADTAASLAERARPNAEDLARVDEPAPMTTFDETPATATVPSTSEVEDTTQATTDGTNLSPSGSPPGDTSAASSKEGTTKPAKKTFKSRFQNIAHRVPVKQHKQQVHTELESGRKYLKEHFPKERQDQFVYRLKKVVVECQSQQEYQNSLSWFLAQIENYFKHGRTAAESGATQTTTFFSDPLFKQATSEARIFLERCANGQNMDGMISAARQLWEDAQADEDLRAWWKRVDAFVKKSLLEPGFILAPMFDSQARQLRDESRQFFDVKYKTNRENFTNAVQAWFRAWAEDPVNKQIAHEWSTLVKDLLFNETGNLTYKPHLWSDVRDVIFPVLTEKVGYVPIPRIEYTDDNLDLVIENLTLQGRNLFPNILELQAQNYIKISPYKSIKDQHHHKLTITLSQIQADMRDVAFYYRKKGGLRISDSGLADVFLGGKGITITIKLSSTTDERARGASLFKVADVKVKVHALKFAIRDSRHDLLYKALRPLATGLIKKQISKAIADGIRTGLEYADHQLVDVHNRMNVAHESEDGSRRQVLKEIITSSKTGDASSVSSQASSAKHKRSSTFRIVPKRDSMLLPDKGYEEGWIRRQAERDTAAVEGEGWHSKAFSIVPATA